MNYLLDTCALVWLVNGDARLSPPPVSFPSQSSRPTRPSPSIRVSKPFGKPHGDALERQLTFCRADGTDTNGILEYQDFPTTQLAAITKV